MRSDLPLQGGATPDAAQAAAIAIPAVDASTGSAASSPGVFNPTRTKLLEAFRLDTAIVRGSGHRLYDVAGHEYLDFLSQYGAVPLGHNPPALWEIVQRAKVEQMVSMIQPLIPTSAQALARRLGEITPGDLEACVFTNSGAEAVEAAIKLVRARTGRLGILSTHNSFHGKTLGALSATGRPLYQKPFGAPVPEFGLVPFGDLDVLEHRLAEGHDQIAAFLVEPIQGEGGVIPAPEGYLAAAFALCRRYGVLTIVDEIQTGLGRTGSLFALPSDAGTPDVMVLAKALGGGLMPIGACIARRDVWDDRFGLLHSSTFANNNLACEVALGVIDLLVDENQRIVRHVATHGAYLSRRLEALQRRFPRVVKDVRGRGFMVGLEFEPCVDLNGSGTLTYCSMNDRLIALFSGYLFNVHRVLTAPMFNSSHVMRLQPPFTVGRPEIDKVVDALADLCDALERADCYQLVQHLVSRPAQSANPGRCRPDSEPASPSRRQNYAPTSMPVPIRLQAAPDPERVGKFAFLLHYTATDDIVRTDPSFESFSVDELDAWATWSQSLGPGLVHHLRGIRSAAGHEAEGWLIALPMLPRDMLKMGRRRRAEMLERATALGAERGAEVVGLGGFTAIVTHGGRDLVGHGPAITSGNTLTSVVALEAIEEAAATTGLDLGLATAAVVGATGAIGRLVSLLLAGRVGSLTLVGNPANPTSADHCRRIAGEVYRTLLSTRFRCSGEHTAGSLARRASPGLLHALTGTAPVRAALERRLRDVVNSDVPGDNARLCDAVECAYRDAGLTPPIRCRAGVGGALLDADVVVTATSADTVLVTAEDLRAGTIVCDVARPANVAADVAQQQDVLVFEGGLVQLPEPLNLGSILGMSPGVCWGCLGETILLALEGETADCSIGGRLSLVDAEHIAALARKHGFRSAPLQWAGAPVRPEDCARVRKLSTERGEQQASA